MGFEGAAEMLEVQPSGVGWNKAPGDNFAGVIIQGEQEHGFVSSGPPSVNRGIVLPEFAEVGTLPAPAGSGCGRRSGEQVGQMRLHVGGYGGTCALEVKAPAQFIGD